MAAFAALAQNTEYSSPRRFRLKDDVSIDATPDFQNGWILRQNQSQDCDPTHRKASIAGRQAANNFLLFLKHAALTQQAFCRIGEPLLCEIDCSRSCDNPTRGQRG